MIFNEISNFKHVDNVQILLRNGPNLKLCKEFSAEKLKPPNS